MNLKPCPSGCNPKQFIRICNIENRDYFIQCSCGWSTAHYMTKESAIKAWNTRSPTSTELEVLDNLISDVIETADIWHRGEVDCTKLRVFLVKAICSKFHAPVRVPSKIEPGTICSWLKNGRECDIYIDGYNKCVDDLSKQGG